MFVVRGIACVYLDRTMARQQGGERLVDENRIGNSGSDASSILEQGRVHRRAQACSTHATTMPRMPTSERREADILSTMVRGIGDSVVMVTSRRADMFTMDGRPSEDDPREQGPRLADERTTLVEALRCQRLTLELKCADLDAEQLARRAIHPSTMSLLGLVRHLADGERETFRVMMAGDDARPLFGSSADRDGDFNGAVGDPHVVEEAWVAWRAEVDFATRFVDEAPSLDITGGDPLNRRGSGGGDISLREVLVGTIEEYARHMGHADLLREQIDGRLGQ